MKASLAEESRRLVSSWMRHDDAMLRDYLVEGVQDPWVNPQSQQARQFLAAWITGREWPGLAAQEARFAAVIRWLWDAGRRDGDSEWFGVVRHALERGADDAEGTEIPSYVREAYATGGGAVDGVEVPNLARRACVDGVAGGTYSEARTRFGPVWKAVLDAHPPAGLRVLEPACGSANDFRVWADFGLARHVDYEGFDLCERNVANARTLFPGARFAVGNAFAIAHPDAAFDVVLVHDLFEHLSEEGLEVALAEVARVARKGLFLGFFQMHEEEEHLIQPVEEYHVNRLSLGRIRTFLETRGFRTQAVHVDTWLRSEIGGREPFYEEWAYDVLGWKVEGQA